MFLCKKFLPFETRKLLSFVSLSFFFVRDKSKSVSHIAVENIFLRQRESNSLSEQERKRRIFELFNFVLGNETQKKRTTASNSYYHLLRGKFMIAARNPFTVKGVDNRFTSECRLLGW